MISSNPTGRSHNSPISAVGQTVVPTATATLIVVLFISCLLPPVYFTIGSTNLSLTRIFLLFAILPLFVRLLSGQAGRLMVPDYMIMAYCGWILITYTYHYGTARIALSGITIVEQFGAYLLGRLLIRNETDYTIFIRTFFVALVVLFPFAVFELFTGSNILAALFDPLFSVHVKQGSAYGRIGLERVMSGFEHPILFGLFCSLGMANFFYMYQPRMFKAIVMMVFTAAMTFMSLSSAPLMAVASQTLMITWDKVTKGRWILLSVLAVVSYVTIDALSNRTPVSILISTLTFNPMSAWARVSTWDYGSAVVLANPIMGIGLEDWPRPFWLTSSVDNFWLLISMRHGFPAIIFLFGTLIFHLAAILRAKNLSSTLIRYRTGYVLALLCLYFTLSTVHIWGGTSSFVFFYIGAGLWFVDAAGQVSGPVPNSTTANQVDMPARRRIAEPTPSAGSGLVGPLRSRGLPQSRFPTVHKREHRDD